MAVLSKDQILAVDDITRELVPVPEWGGDVFVGIMSGAARDAWEMECAAAKESKRPTPDNFRATLCAHCICDEKGARLFALSDIPALGKKSAVALDRVFEVALRVNKIGAKDREGLEKN
jgi:hypothetical protein